VLSSHRCSSICGCWWATPHMQVAKVCRDAQLPVWVVLVGAPPATDDDGTPAATPAAAATATSNDFRLDPATTRAFQALAAVTGGCVRALRQSPLPALATHRLGADWELHQRRWGARCVRRARDSRRKRWTSTAGQRRRCSPLSETTTAAAAECVTEASHITLVHERTGQQYHPHRCYPRSPQSCSRATQLATSQTAFAPPCAAQVGAIPTHGLGTNTVLVAAADVRLHQHVLNDLLASPQWLPYLQRLAGDDTPLPSSAAASDATVLEVTNVLMEVAAATTAAGMFPTT
jgi:hypothetical protein